MDLNTAFLNCVVEVEIYIEKLEGFETYGREKHVCRLNRSLYGIKQGPQAWYTHIKTYLNRLGFTKSEAYSNLYHIVVDGNFLILVLYVDELILTGDEQLIHS